MLVFCWSKAWGHVDVLRLHVEQALGRGCGGGGAWQGLKQPVQRVDGKCRRLGIPLVVVTPTHLLDPHHKWLQCITDQCNASHTTTAHLLDHVLLLGEAAKDLDLREHTSKE